MTTDQLLSRRAIYALLLTDTKDPPNEAERAALEAAIRALDTDLNKCCMLHIELSQPKD